MTTEHDIVRLAREAGYKHGYEGLGSHHNPYVPNSKLYNEWARSYSDGANDYKRERREYA